MITFKDVWKPPFKYDGCGYIWDSQRTMAFTFEIPETAEEDKEYDAMGKNIVEILNGGEGEKYEGLEIKEGCDLYKDGKMIGCFRGWGHLTGTGGLRLSGEEAAKVQDEFINWVLEKIKATT